MIKKYQTNNYKNYKQIYTKINELLQEISKKDQTIVKINISNLNKIDIHILEAIFSEYNAEIIEKELFIKVSFYIIFKLYILYKI